MRWCLLALAAAWLHVEPQYRGYDTVDESPASPAEKTVTAVFLALQYGMKELNETIAATPQGLQDALNGIRPTLTSMQEVCQRQHDIAEAINEDTAMKMQGWQENMMKNHQGMNNLRDNQKAVMKTVIVS